MTIERGLVVGGRVLPGTEWCIRDASAWWKAGERGTRKRARVRDLLCGHWTAGEASIARYDDDGPSVVRSMRARANPETGAPMHVGIELVIGACAPDDEYARVWQTADPGETATVHVAVGEVNARAIGCEVVSCGVAAKIHPRRQRDVVERTIRGAPVACAAFFPGQLRSWVRLAEALSDETSDILTAAGIRIARAIPATPTGTLLPEVRHLTRPELREHSGAIEHCLVTHTTKLDAGGQLLAELDRAGWERRAL